MDGKGRPPRPRQRCYRPGDPVEVGGTALHLAGGRNRQVSVEYITIAFDNGNNWQRTVAKDRLRERKE